jgi:WD40 repeat protein
VNSVAFSPDGALLASGSKDETIVRWLPTDGEMVGEPLVQRGWVNEFALSPDGGLLVSASHLGTFSVWDLSSNAQIGEAVPSNTASVETVAFSPDGDFVASGSLDGTIIIRPTSSLTPDLDRMTDHLCAVAGRNLTNEEWNEFLPFRPYEPTCPEFAS